MSCFGGFNQQPEKSDWFLLLARHLFTFWMADSQTHAHSQLGLSCRDWSPCMSDRVACFATDGRTRVEKAKQFGFSPFFFARCTSAYTTPQLAAYWLPLILFHSRCWCSHCFHHCFHLIIQLLFSQLSCRLTRLLACSVWVRRFVTLGNIRAVLRFPALKLCAQ